jgi:NADH dehydrogenase (ubiquinone) Fe-S protein 3
MPINLNCLSKLIPIFTTQTHSNENSIVISDSKNIFILKFLKLNINTQFSVLSCISGVDLHSKSMRLNVVYDLLSLTYNTRLRVKFFVSEYASVQSSTCVYINANWWEREVWDLFGVYFYNHPDLRRILTDYGFEGHPLRKDFPLSGYTQMRYNDSKKRIVSEPLRLSQEYRFFLFETGI